ncbi:MAG TPA: N-acetyl-gamma-glutamyl-phosphate reductase [Actinomycetota bacterium]|nr:N-acetyl-gamma-glutamyl-phosphate reductase [Actinomycetota bacterium]
MAYRAAVAGASGYTGAELLRLLESHPSFVTSIATSREFAGRKVADVYPNLRTDLAYTELEPSALEDADVAFLALPHGASMEIGARLAKAGVAVVDLSADFRLKDAALYPEWFGKDHIAPEALEDWAYGLPELHRDEIKQARAIANPGCYPTAAILALAPLVKTGLIDPASIVVSAASGVSGAGRKLTNDIHFSHVDANFKAYGLPAHKHTPEIEQELGSLAGVSVRITFIPHLVPMPRGLLATCVANATGDDDPAAAARAMYDGEPFVRVLDAGMPETKYTLGSNQCLLGYSRDLRTGRVVAVAAIDNLGKGAAGQALQNANLMFGLPEDEGLTGGGLYP